MSLLQSLQCSFRFNILVLVILPSRLPMLAVLGGIFVLRVRLSRM